MAICTSTSYSICSFYVIYITYYVHVYIHVHCMFSMCIIISYRRLLHAQCSCSIVYISGTKHYILFFMLHGDVHMDHNFFCCMYLWMESNKSTLSKILVVYNDLFIPYNFACFSSYTK